MTCDDCGSLLRPDGTCSNCGAKHEPADWWSGDQNSTSTRGINQSININGGNIDGTLSNHIDSSANIEEPVDQSITVDDSGVEGEVANYYGTDRDGEAAELVETARSELQQRREELEEATATSDLDAITQLFALVDDGQAIERLQELDVDSGVGPYNQLLNSDPVPVAHTLDALAEVDRLAAAGDDLEELYVAIEKAVRLLNELDTDVEEELQAFVDRQRVLTEGSLFDEELSTTERTSLELLCDRARDAVAREVGGSR